MQKVHKILPIFFMLFFAVSIVMQSPVQAANDKIGVLDMNKVLTTSNAGKRAQGTIEQKMKSYQTSFEKEGKALKDMRDEMEKKGSTWNEATRKSKVEAFQKKGRELAEKENKANEELQKMREQNINPIVKKLEEIVENIAKKEGYTAILPRNVVLYHQNSADITNKVITEMNKALK